MSKWKKRFESLVPRVEKAEADVSDLEREAERLKRAAKRGRLVILFAKAGEHLAPLYDELINGADLTVDNDVVDVSAFGDTNKMYIAGPSTITIRVTK